MVPMVAAWSLAGCGNSDGNGMGGGPSGPMAVQVHVLAPTPLEDGFTASGTLVANESVALQSEVSGRITQIGFEEGGRVSAGQVLLRIDDDDLQAQLRKAEAELQLAQVTEERQARLLEVKGISQEAFDATRTERTGREAAVDNLRALLDKYTVRAPFSGTIGLRRVSPGGYVAPGTVIATLVQADPIKVDFAVPERHARRLRPGGTVDLTVEGDTAHWTAVVYAGEADVDPGTRSISMRARCPNPDGRLTPGGYARVEVRLGTIADALVVPSDALVPDIGGEKVMLMKGGKARSARVRSGIRTETAVQIFGDVRPGDTVITSALLAVRDGMAVRPAERKRAPNAGARKMQEP